MIDNERLDAIAEEKELREEADKVRDALASAVAQAQDKERELRDRADELRAIIAAGDKAPTNEPIQATEAVGRKKLGRVYCGSCGNSRAVGKSDCTVVCAQCGGADRVADRQSPCADCGSQIRDTLWPACCGVTMVPEDVPVSSCSCTLGPGEFSIGGWHQLVTSEAYWQHKLWISDYQARSGLGPSMDTAIREETVLDDDGTALVMPITIRMDLDRRSKKLAGSKVATVPCPHYVAAVATRVAASIASKGTPQGVLALEAMATSAAKW